MINAQRIVYLKKTFEVSILTSTESNSREQTAYLEDTLTIEQTIEILSDEQQVARQRYFNSIDSLQSKSNDKRLVVMEINVPNGILSEMKLHNKGHLLLAAYSSDKPMPLAAVFYPMLRCDNCRSRYQQIYNDYCAEFDSTCPRQHLPLDIYIHCYLVSTISLLKQIVESFYSDIDHHGIASVLCCPGAESCRYYWYHYQTFWRQVCHLLEYRYPIQFMDCDRHLLVGW